MQMIQAFRRGKRPDQSLCEDGYVVTDHYAAVVDGSTSKRAATYAEAEGATGRPAAAAGAEPAVAGTAMTGGRQAMLAVTAAIPMLPPELTAGEAVGRLTATLRALWPAGAGTDAALRPTCSAVIFSNVRREVWMVGDCQCHFDGHTVTNTKLVDACLTRIRCDIVRRALATGHTVEELERHDPGRAFIYDALREQTNFQNVADACNPYAYAVLDGAAVLPERIKVIPVPASCRHLVLTSDGYPVVLDTLEATEAALRRLLREDPLCIGPLAGTKGLQRGNASFDDRTYLSLRLT